MLYTGGLGQNVRDGTEGKISDLPQNGDLASARDSDDPDSRIQAARDRFLARKAKK